MTEQYTEHDLSQIEAEDFDIGGYFDSGDSNKGGAYRDTPVDIEETEDESGEYNVGWISTGEWLEYTVDVPESGEYELHTRLAGKNETALEVSVDEEHMTTVPVPETGDWQNWETVSVGPVPIEEGTHTIRLTANGGDFNLNWFGFEHTGDDEEEVSVPDTYRAVSDGDWSDESVWNADSVPQDGSNVSIDAGVTVTLRGETNDLDWVTVGGALEVDPSVDTHLRADTVWTEPESTLEIGTEDSPIEPDSEARMTFLDTGPIDENIDPERKSRGLVVMGEVTIVGAEKTSWDSLESPPESGDSEISLVEEPQGWSGGDRVVIPGLEHEENQDEERYIESVDGATVTLDESLEYDHVPPKEHLDAYVLNLTRNVVFESENTDESRRGHVMFMSEGTETRYVRFDELGRTNKKEYLTNPVRNAGSLPTGLDPNPAARYALHWHRTGSDTEDPQEVEGVVVDGTPGWGIVNHHSYANVVDSITYDVTGAGFVAEGGNERGVFKRNFALRSEGSGEPIDSRSAGEAHGGSPPIDDFGHAGHGFWSQSPLVEMVDNVAAGHRHFAFVYWTRPLLDASEETLAESTPEELEDSRVNFVPNMPMEWLGGRQEPLLEAIEGQRFYTDEMDKLMWEKQKIPSTFARLRRVEGNTAFASAGGLDFSRNNFKWKHERFSDFSTIEDMTVYNIGPFVDDDGDVYEPDPPKHLASGDQGNGGNVGVSFRYTSNVSLVDSELYGEGLENSFAVPFHDYLWTTTVDNCTIENWDWGVVTGEHRLTWIRNNSFTDNNLDVHWGFDNVGPAILDGNDLNSVGHSFEHLNQKATEVFEFDHQRGVRINGRSSHVEESAPDYVPFESEDALDSVNNLDDVFDNPEEIVGMSNKELMDEYGVAISGHLLPDDAVSEPYMGGALLDPEGGRSPQTTAYVDTGSASSMGSFESVDDPDAAGDTAVQAVGADSPKDNPLEMSFDCAEGTYYLYARVRPDALNGDTVSFRIDGGEWKDAEKLKGAAGFQWHDASPNNEDEYTWDLSEGSHTLEIACESEGVRLDEVCLTSDYSVIGGYGMSMDSVEQPEEPEEPAPEEPEEPEEPTEPEEPAPEEPEEPAPEPSPQTLVIRDKNGNDVATLEIDAEASFEDITE